MTQFLNSRETEYKGGDMDTKETNELLDEILGLTSEFATDSNDGIIDGKEALAKVDNIQGILKEVKDKAIIKEELNDLDRAESKVIIDKFVDITWDIIKIVQNKPKFKIFG
ncbi:MAG: hypothetical protein KAT68_17330 [Bacteroidales bacterium]|nr:hypothetical protein [Bacteroidales bacterium]